MSFNSLKIKHKGLKPFGIMTMLFFTRYLIKNCYHLRPIEIRRYNIDRAYGTLNFNRTGRIYP
jgi:hypothetical protein